MPVIVKSFRSATAVGRTSFIDMMPRYLHNVFVAHVLFNVSYDATDTLKLH